MYHRIIIEARDLLFFRDGRPVNNGVGANWPMAQTAYAALNAAFRQRWMQAQEWEATTTQDSNKWRTSNRFQSLKSVGPFPMRDGEVFLPTPSDLKPSAIMAPLLNVPGESNLPQWVSLPVGANLAPSKNECGNWIALSEYRKYLAGKCDVKTIPSSELYDVEERPGISIDEQSRSTKDGKLFFGSYMRLRPSVKMVLWAECMSSQVDVIAQYFANGDQNLVFGGQRGVVTAHLDDSGDASMPSDLLAREVKLTGRQVKWVLLTPAAFQSGALPSFISASGEVMLTVPTGRKPERSAFRNRDDYRRACRDASRKLSARLVAAVIPKNTHYSGWNCEFNRPERTLKLVPAGAVYYFEAEDDSEAQLLAQLLDNSRNSEYFGSQGMGVGICTAFNYLDFNNLNQ